ncbi:MAG: iron-containing alcohol dehydrogenase [Desulfobacterales bacterium]|nr:iron-containing alcohol dehydrogenase [Desulfobacterales bacterium]
MNFRFDLSPSIQFGDNSSKQVGELISLLHAKKVFCIYDPGVKAAGLVDGIIEQIRNTGAKVVAYGDVTSDPSSEIVEDAARIGKKEEVDALVAIGGGSAMDCAKAINILLTNDAPIFKYAGLNEVKRPVKPLIAIPTTSGTSSEVTAATVISDKKEKKKIVILGRHVGPSHALIDPLLTLGLPPAITAATGIDALTHAIESYTSVNASPVTEVHSLKAIELIVKNLPKAFENGNDKKARTQMMLACLHAGFAFGNADLGLVHTIAHPLGALCGISHGDANAAMLPFVLAFNADAVPEKTRDIAKAMGIETKGKSDKETAELAASKLKELQCQIGLKSLKKLGVSPSLFDTLAEDALKEGALQFNPKKPTKKEIISLLEMAF